MALESDAGLSRSAGASASRQSLKCGVGSVASIELDRQRGRSAWDHHPCEFDIVESDPQRAEGDWRVAHGLFGGTGRKLGMGGQETSTRQNRG